jgi:hypothetical protein
MNKDKLCEIKRKNVVKDSVVNWIRWAINLPKAVDTIRTARTPTGRIVKTLLFGLGMAIPLGILLVALLFWHGLKISGRTLHPLAA